MKYVKSPASPGDGGQAAKARVANSQSWGGGGEQENVSFQKFISQHVSTKEPGRSPFSQLKFKKA